MQPDKTATTTASGSAPRSRSTQRDASVITIRTNHSLPPTPPAGQVGRPQPVETINARAGKRRFTSLLPASRESLALTWLSGARPLRTLADEYQVATCAAEEMIRATVRGWVRRSTERRAA